MSRRQTPAARALVGALCLRRSSVTINQAYRLAGYTFTPAFPDAIPGTGRAGIRIVTRGGRHITTTRTAGDAAFWLDRLGRKLEAIGVGKVAA